MSFEDIEFPDDLSILEDIPEFCDFLENNDYMYNELVSNTELVSINSNDLFGSIKEQVSINPDNLCGYLTFKVPIANGLRMRYWSEVQNKSNSGLKGNNNIVPVIQVSRFTQNLKLKFELITNDDKPHFYKLYAITAKCSKVPIQVKDNSYVIDLDKFNKANIELDILGIARMRQREVLPELKNRYPEASDQELKKFFDSNKESVRLMVTLYTDPHNASLDNVSIKSDIIQSKVSSDYSRVNIEHISPKTIANGNEELIVVLEKKINNNDVEAFLESPDLYPNKQLNRTMLTPVYKDNQTFVYKLNPVKCNYIINAKYIIKCGNFEDMKPLKFLPYSQENRKRKIGYEIENHCAPLKQINIGGVARPSFILPSIVQSQTDIQVPQVESAIYGSNIEFDCAPVVSRQRHISTTDSGIYLSKPVGISTKDSDECDDLNQEKSCGRNTNSNIVIDESEDSANGTDDDSNKDNDEEDEDSDFDNSDTNEFETDGRRKIKKPIETYLETIVVKKKIKQRKSQDFLDSHAAMDKILSEVARIGHDYAFGKTELDTFKRFESELPILFTLQDDVGDTPLNNAILQGNEDRAEHILTILAQQCQDALEFRNTSGHTAVILTPACSVSANFLQKLLNAGCRIDAWDDSDKSALIYAIEYGKVDMIDVILQHILRDMKSKSILQRHPNAYYSPLQLAVINENLLIVKTLLDLKSPMKNQYLIDVNEMSLMNNQTALHLAIQHNVDKEIINCILNRDDLNINQLTRGQETALEIAKRLNHEELANILISKGANDDSIVTTDELRTFIMDSDDDDNTMDHTDEDEGFMSRSPASSDKSSNESNSNSIMLISENGSNCVVNGVVNGGISQLTDKMKSMNIKGNIKHELISILANQRVGLNCEEAKHVIRPPFISVLNNCNNLLEVFEKFNCLPQSIGKLFECLIKIKREDLIKEIERIMIERND